MPTIGTDRTIRARKEHKCDLCGLRIRKGATYVYREGVEGREHWRLRMHPVCDDATADWDPILWECLGDHADFRHYELDLQPHTVLNIVAEILGGWK
jgi:hypothetical protein